MNLSHDLPIVAAQITGWNFVEVGLTRCHRRTMKEASLIGNLDPECQDNI